MGNVVDNQECQKSGRLTEERQQYADKNGERFEANPKKGIADGCKGTPHPFAETLYLLFGDLTRFDAGFFEIHSCADYPADHVWMRIEKADVSFDNAQTFGLARHHFPDEWHHAIAETQSDHALMIE
jgi:hypothetical protein